MSNLTEAARWLHEVPDRRSGQRNTNIVVNEDGTISYTKPNGERAVFSKADIGGYATIIQGTDRDFDRTQEADRSYEPGATGRPLPEDGATGGMALDPGAVTAPPFPREQVEPIPSAEEEGTEKPSIDAAIKELEEAHGYTITKGATGYQIEEAGGVTTSVTVNQLFQMLDASKRIKATKPPEGLTQDQEEARLMGWDFEGWGKDVSLPTYDARTAQDIEDERPPIIVVDWSRVGAIIRNQQALAIPGAYGGEPTEQKALQKASALGPNFTVKYNPETATWYPIEKEEEEILTLPQRIAKLVGEGRIDEAMKLDQIRDQLNEERLTPQRAAEMLVDVAYNPVDFKQMMDAMLDRDSGLDPTTVNIPELQRQATAMLRGEPIDIATTPPVPTLAETGVPVSSVVHPPSSLALERDVARRDVYGRSPEEMVDLTRAGQPSALFQPTLEQALIETNMEEGLESDELSPLEQMLGRPFVTPPPVVPPPVGDTPYDPTADPMAYIRASRNLADTTRWKSPGQLRTDLGRELTPEETTAAAVVLPPQYGAMAAQAMQRAQEAQELRDLYSGANYPGSLNIPYASTKARIKELGKYLGKDAAAFERNQRLQQQRKQQIFEARRPAGASRRYM